MPLTEDNMSTLLVDGSVILLLIGVLVETGIMRRRGRNDDKLFFMMVIMNMALAVFDIMTYLAAGKTFPGARIFNMGGISAYYFTLILMLMVWFHYCLVRFGWNGKGADGSHRAFFVPGLVTEAGILINIFTGWIFSVDENNVYHRGILYIPMYIVIVYFVIICIISSMKYKSGTSGKSLIPIWVYILPFAVSMAAPFVAGGVSMTAAGCAMSIVFTHLGSAFDMLDYKEEGGERE